MNDERKRQFLVTRRSVSKIDAPDMQPAPETPQQQTPSSLRARWDAQEKGTKAAIIGAIGVITAAIIKGLFDIGVVIWQHPPIPTPNHETQVTLDTVYVRYPDAGVPYIVISASQNHVQPDKHYWVVRSEKPNLLWPYEEIKFKGMSWRDSLQAESSIRTKTFEILLVEIDDSIHREFLAWQDSLKRDGSYPGIPQYELPPELYSTIDSRSIKPPIQ